MVHLALTHFFPFLAHSHVIARTDNMAVVSHTNQTGMNRHVRQLLLWAQDNFFSLRAVHVPGVLKPSGGLSVETETQVGGMDAEPPDGGSDLLTIRRYTSLHLRSRPNAPFGSPSLTLPLWG